MEHGISSIHKCTLKLVYEDYRDLTFKELLGKDKSVIGHQEKRLLLATKIWKLKSGILP